MSNTESTQAASEGERLAVIWARGECDTGVVLGAPHAHALTGWNKGAVAVATLLVEDIPTHAGGTCAIVR